ncbi:MAG: 23S rRNA (guanosine(2251)-2'-O)-methyltransferase RlmB [Anaerolineaceae bacterium]|jgi:23S rRNA (guanosine2251-2'-O)-methyltransferase|nr:23S rRNA (guanosine(2251)-2'-O)-methyltransferase RlmB [Anaerolineaceae bacterium]
MAKEWITGRNPVYEVLAARRRHVFRLLVAKGVEQKGRIHQIIQMAAKINIQVEYVPRQQIDAMGENPQGIALQTNLYPYSDLHEILQQPRKRGEPLFILLLDVLQDPQNLGTLLRTAEAVGIHGVFMPANRAAGVTPAVVHASSGASEHLLVAQGNLAQAISAIKDAGGWVMGLEGGPEAQPIFQMRLDGPLALVVGSEGSGLRALTRKSCDVLISLPMRGQIESLNAAVAGSVALYTAFNARQK